MTPKFFRTPDALRRWFATYGTTRTELWIGYYKKASGKGGVVYQQALDEALCVGWIDGVIKSIDESRYMQRYTPRKQKSNWSNVNVRRMQVLIDEGRVTSAGLAAYARRVPERTGVYSFERPSFRFSGDFSRRFKAAKRAWLFFAAQPAGYRRTVTAYVMSAKQAATRERRFTHVLTHSLRGERIPQLAPPAKRKPLSA